MAIGKIEQEILLRCAELARKHGPVAVELGPEGMALAAAPDGVLRGLMEDECIAALELKEGRLTITPAPAGLERLLTEDTGLSRR